MGRRAAAALAALGRALNEDGLTVRGASGQWRLNASATELCQGA